MVLVVLEFGSMLVLYFEADAPGANITTGGDAVWWAFVSITTVGYGDKYPITTVVAPPRSSCWRPASALFGVLSGYLANFFLSPSKSDEPEPATETATATDDTTLLAMVDELEANIASLRARIADRASTAETPEASA